MNKSKEKKIEEEIEKKAEEFEKRAEDWGKKVEKEWSDRNKGKTAEYIANIVINLILIIIWDRLPEWFSWITGSFVAMLPLFYLSFALTIIVNFAFVLIPSKTFVAFGKLALNTISIIVMISLYYIYPFDFSGVANYWDIVARTIIIVGIFGTAIGAIVETIKTLSSKLD
jgi:hypothetical protein